MIRRLVLRCAGLVSPFILTLALLFGACSPESAGIALRVQAPVGVALNEFQLTIQDHDKRVLVFQPGIQPVSVLTKGRDISAEPLRIGLRLAAPGNYLIHIRASESKLVPDGVIPSSRDNEYFFVGLVHANGTVQVDALLLPVAPKFDVDFDHFPDAMTWPASDTTTNMLYSSKRSLLDCVDQDPSPTQPKLPAGFFAVDINPLAKPRCGLPFDISCGDSVPPCQDLDGDGDPESTDCDDNDPNRFHGNSRPRNCCVCTDKSSCATDHSKLGDTSKCMPARCDSDVDYDCTGKRIPCFVDDDCDGYSPNDPNVSQRDCDDTNPSVYPGAPKNCSDTSKDWACDGNPNGGCTSCDLDGDGYERNDKAQGGSCPSAAYTASGKKIDCDDNDRGVFPGSTMYNGPSQIMGFADLAGKEGGGSKVAALRRLCWNTLVDGTTAQDADCDSTARNGCPTAACDVDGDGFPKDNTATCNPGGLLPIDNNDTDYQSFPSAPDHCGDGKPQNGVADTPCSNDKDGDGYNADADCDDTDPNTHPWAAEGCDGKDNDCDGLIDEQNPDDKGARLVEKSPVTGKNVILSCTDFYRGECGRNDATTGLKTGRCVCSGIVPGKHDSNALRKACPATVDTAATAPKCFSAQQPTKQTCEAVVANRKDQDCDGRLDAPDGMNLLEYGQACGVNTGTCIAGTVNGCDYTKTNPFSIATGYAVVPAFDEARKYLTCTGATGPSKQLCDGKDQNCNNVVDDCADYAAANSSCCKNVAMCVNVANDFTHCGNCSTACDTATANACVNKQCMCGANPACNGARGMCKNGTTCVECMADVDCGNPAKPICKGQDHCVECAANADCAASANGPACDSTAEICVACTAGFGCNGATPKCKVNANPTLNQCVQCVTNADCSGATPACDTATNTCVPCITGFGCTAPNSQCKLSAMSAKNQCVQCLFDGNCSGSTPACDTTVNKCVTCTAANKTQCTGATALCLVNAVNPTLNKCVGCTANAQCTVSPRLLCDIGGQYKCAACLLDMDCRGMTPFCYKDAVDVTKNVCTACNVDMDCGAGKFCFVQTNPANNFCGDCKTDADCPAMNPACDPTKKLCVPCRVDGAILPHMGCANPVPACKTNTDPTLNMCVECTQTSHCMGIKTCLMNNCV